MRTVVETPTYLKATLRAGLSDDDRKGIVEALAYQPLLGDVMQGTGGCRKARFSRANRGKSGGVRVIYLQGGSNVPLFLLTVYPKNWKANLTAAEKQELSELSRKIYETYKKK